MWSTIFLKFFLRHLKVCEILCCSPFKWNKKTGRVIRVQSKGKLIFYRIQCALHLIYMIAMLHQLIFGKVPTPMKLQGLVFFTIYLILLTARWNWKLSIAPMQLMNSFLDFEDTIPDDIKKEKSFEDKALTFYLYCLQSTIPLFPVMNIIVLSNNPCSLPFLGSLSPYCTHGIWSNPPTRVWMAMLTFETWMGYQIFYSGTLWILYTFFVGTVCILDYLHYVQKMLNRIPKAGVNKIPSSEDGGDVETTVRKNISNSMKLEASHAHCLYIYRSIQTLEKMYNVFLKNQIVPGMVSCLPGIQIFSQYVCIKLHSEIPMPGFLVFPMVLLDAALNNILMFTLAAGVNTFSGKILLNFKRELVGFKRGAAIKKVLKSCTKLKISFGSNFIDNGTPLVIQDFCLSQTLSLLLIKSNYK